VKNTVRLITIFSFGLVSLLILSAVLAGCTAAAKTPTPSSAASVQSPSSTPAATQGFGRGQGASGTLSSINGTTLTLATAQGNVTVSASSGVAVERTESGTISDLKVGEVVTVIGAADANGVIAAGTVDAIPQLQGALSALPSGVAPGSRRTPAAGGTASSNFLNGSGAGTLGTIASINGNTFTLNDAQGQETVDIGSDTVIQKTVSGTFSDLQPGDFLTVVGSTDANGAITATRITDLPQGTLAGRGARGGAPTSTTSPTPTPAPSPTAQPSSPTAPQTSVPVQTLTPTPTVAPSTIPPVNPPIAGNPIITIISPFYNATIPSGDITVEVVVSNFTLADKLGQPAANGEGHIVYYLDALPPTAQGQTALTKPGTSAETADTSYTWTNVAAGPHSLSVQLVNNDGTPLIPPATMTETIQVQ
jgi:hypothetical protein